jgi:hypothetical protein
MESFLEEMMGFLREKMGKTFGAWIGARDMNVNEMMF